MTRKDDDEHTSLRPPQRVARAGDTYGSFSPTTPLTTTTAATTSAASVLPPPPPFTPPDTLAVVQATARRRHEEEECERPDLPRHFEVSELLEQEARERRWLYRRYRGFFESKRYRRQRKWLASVPWDTFRIAVLSALFVFALFVFVQQPVRPPPPRHREDERQRKPCRHPTRDVRTILPPTFARSQTPSRSYPSHRAGLPCLRGRWGAHVCPTFQLSHMRVL